ncbi:MAG TPA: hypothetical protein VIG44_01280, partial [Thermomicrobiales bacterium]
MRRWHILPRVALGALVLTCVITLSGCGGGKATTAPAASGGGAKAGPTSLYPNPSLTPGDVFPNVTAKEVCVSGYSSSVRSVSSDEKAAVYQRYGIPNVSGKHEVDHFISLELGGSNMLTNLWPEPYVTPDAPNKIGAHEKDKVENYLHDQVCKNGMTLPQAQEQIRTDWYAVYLKIA